MYVACSTACFTRYPLERALRTIAELEFNKVEIFLDERGPHLRPSEVAADLTAAAQRIRIGPSLSPAAFTVETQAPDEAEHQRQLQAICHLARLSHVSVVTISAAPTGTDPEHEVRRLKSLVHLAEAEGVVLSVVTRTGTLTETPETAAALCRDVPGLGLTLDPSHYLIGPNRGKSFEQVYPYVCHVHLRDSGLEPDQFQVRIGQGEVEYGRIIAQLARHHYRRLLAVEIFDIPEAPYAMEHEVRKLKYLLESLV